MTAEAALEHLRGGDPAGALALLDATDTAAACDAAHHCVRGMALLGLNQPAAALIALRAAIALGEATPTALLNLAIAEDRAGDQARGRALMQELAVRLPDWDEPPLRLAESLRSSGATDAAEAAYGRVLERNPRREEALVALGGLLIARGDGAAASTLLLRCCGIAPDRAEAWDALGLALRLTGDTALAHTAFIEAQHLAPTVAEYALHGIDAALAASAADAELARLAQSAATDPMNPVPQLARGMLLERLGARAEAIDALEAAAALAPHSVLAATLLAGVLSRSTRLREADAALQRAIELDPAKPTLRNDRAAVLMRMHRHAEARTLLRELIAEHGEHAPVLCNLANATVCLGWQDEAVDLARRAISCDPDAVLPRRALCNTLPYHPDVTAAALLAAQSDCAARLPRSDLGRFTNRRDPDRKLSIGLLSGSLRTHPVGWLTVAGFETLDPLAFDIICLVQNAAPTDPMARRFRSIAREWIDVDALDDLTLARRARDLGIDVLIDLGGFGDAARMAACAHRLAPVQVKWVGMQTHSTGLPEIDWIITDRWETPPELAPFYSERLMRLPDGYVCYSPPPYAPDVVALPALHNGFVTFGCFNNLAKVTPRVIAAWSQILHRLPEARLVLKTHQLSDAATADRLRAAFAEYGVAPARVELRGASPHRDFMAEYGQIDIVLDPFPYSGGLTTCEALWMGVPTVMLPGEIFAARHSLSHMSNVGLTGWAADDAAGYVELAVAKATDVAALAVLRAGLRARVKASPLCDALRFGRNLGAALRQAWREWCGT